MSKILLYTLLTRERNLLFKNVLPFVLNSNRKFKKRYLTTMLLWKIKHMNIETVTFESFLTSVKRHNVTNIKILVKEDKIY